MEIRGELLNGSPFDDNKMEMEADLSVTNQAFVDCWCWHSDGC